MKKRKVILAEESLNCGSKDTAIFCQTFGYQSNADIYLDVYQDNLNIYLSRNCDPGRPCYYDLHENDLKKGTTKIYEVTLKEERALTSDEKKLFEEEYKNFLKQGSSGKEVK